MKNAVEKIELIEKIQAEKMKLLKELKRSLQAESKKFHAFQDPATKGQIPRYFLIDLATHKELCYGPMKRLKSYMNLRNIGAEDVFNETSFKF